MRSTKAAATRRTRRALPASRGSHLTAWSPDTAGFHAAAPCRAVSPRLLQLSSAGSHKTNGAIPALRVHADQNSSSIQRSLLTTLAIRRKVRYRISRNVLRRSEESGSTVAAGGGGWLSLRRSAYKASVRGRPRATWGAMLGSLCLLSAQSTGIRSRTRDAPARLLTKGRWVCRYMSTSAKPARKNSRSS